MNAYHEELPAIFLAFSWTSYMWYVVVLMEDRIQKSECRDLQRSDHRSTHVTCEYTHQYMALHIPHTCMRGSTRACPSVEPELLSLCYEHRGLSSGTVCGATFLFILLACSRMLDTQHSWLFKCCSWSLHGVLQSLVTRRACRIAQWCWEYSA